MTSKVEYLGQLRTRCVHLGSQAEFITDAPVDNHGKGEAFSPTDTVATALASCVLTVMGIKAREMGQVLDGTFAEVTKTMASNPRRIEGIAVRIRFSSTFARNEQKILEKTARSCPVWYSLHPDIILDISFEYPE